jgi:hypothetical protein
MGGKPVVMPYEHKAFYLDSAALLKFVGTIKANNRQYTVERDGNKLFIKGGHNFKMGLTAESATKFFFDNGTDNQLEFELDQQKIKTVWVISMGVKTAVEKLL